MDYKNVNDYEVMYMVRENNDDAMNLLFDKYMPLIKKLAVKYYDKVKECGIEFEDFIQEGMIALNRAIMNYDENSDTLLYTYISVCIERQFITYCRNLNSQKHCFLNNSVRDECLCKNRCSDSKSFMDYIEIMESFTSLKNNFEFLDSNIFELRYNGFSYKEICTLLDISYSFLESRMSKIRKLLRKKEKTFI